MVVDEPGEFVTQRELPAWRWCARPCAPATWCCARPACWRCTSPSTRSRAGPRARVERRGRGLRHGRPRGPVVQRLPRPARCAWCASTPRSSGVSDPTLDRRHAAQTAFADGFPLLVVVDGLADRAQRAAAPRRHGAGAVERFRPNLVLDGLRGARRGPDRPHHASTARRARCVLRLVKPCTRCSIPDVDPRARRARPCRRRHAARPTAPTRAWTAQVTFGMNAIDLKTASNAACASARRGARRFASSDALGWRDDPAA